MTALAAELFDVRSDRLGHAQTVQREQRDQRLVPGVDGYGSVIDVFVSSRRDVAVIPRNLVEEGVDSAKHTMRLVATDR